MSSPPHTTLTDEGLLLTAEQAGLPSKYLTDRGKDFGDKPRPVSIRSDLAAFVHTARTAYPLFADQITWRLQLLPWAVCVLGPTLPGGWDAYAHEAAGYIEAARLAALNVTQESSTNGPLVPRPIVWAAPATISTSSDLAGLYQLAKDMFCPTGSGTSIGDPTEHLPGWSAGGDQDVRTMQQLLPWWMLDVQLGGGTVEVNGTGAAGAVYAVVAAVPELAEYTGGVVHLFIPSQCFGELPVYESLRTPTPPDYWAGEQYLGGYAIVDVPDVTNQASIRLEAQAIVEVGCRSVRGH